MTNTTKTTTMALALAGLLGTGCDTTGYFPITAKQAGTPTVTLDVATGTLGLEYLPDGVRDVEVELSEIWMHEATEDRWVAINAEPVVVTLADAGGSVTVGRVFVPEGTYDEITVQLDGMKVRVDAVWSGVFVEDSELRWARTFDVLDDGRLRIDVDVSRGLVEEPPGWVGSPALSVDLQQ